MTLGVCYRCGALVVVVAFALLGEGPSTQEWIGVTMFGAGVIALALK
jgi:uncharacterized membrane protein